MRQLARLADVEAAVPEGEFKMGSAEGNPDERPAHIVALDGFWIDY
jgi:formylglycine-generating enzyme required for sulfatase activity